jgi:hypothetical protein
MTTRIACANRPRAVTCGTHADHGAGVTLPLRWLKRILPKDPSSGAVVEPRPPTIGSLHRQSLRADLPSNLNGAGYSRQAQHLSALAKRPYCAATVAVAHRGLRSAPRRHVSPSHYAAAQHNQLSSAGGIMAFVLVSSHYIEYVADLIEAGLKRGWSL